MKRKILILLISLFSLTGSAQNVETFVNRQLDNYPHLRLLDLYKSCFQDYMGAEHLASDYDRMKNYLDEELKTAEEFPSWDYEPCGIYGNYVRVNIRVVKDGRFSEDKLLDAFVRSANVKRPPVKKWKRMWSKLIRKIDRMQLCLPHYKQDKHFIDSLLNKGQYAISHSPEYRNTYHPHYRIVERHIFENELKPLLSRRPSGTENLK